MFTYTFIIPLQVLKGECFSFSIAAVYYLFSYTCFSEFKEKQSEKLRSPFQFKPNLQRSQSEGFFATQFTPYITASHEKISSACVFPTFQERVVHGKGIRECRVPGQARRKSTTPTLIVCSSSGRVVQILWSSEQEQFSALQAGTQAHSTFSVVGTRHAVTVTVGQIDFWHRSNCKLQVLLPCSCASRKMRKWKREGQGRER